MAYRVPALRGNRRKALDIVVDEFDGGYNSYFDEARTPMNSVRESLNCWQDQDALWTPRPGTRDYAVVGNTIDGFGKFVEDDGDGTATEYYWWIDNGAFKYAKDAEAATTVSGVTWTTGNTVRGLQIKNRLYLANGTDALAFYNITAGTLTPFTGLDTPAKATPTRGAGLATGNFDHFYRISAVNTVGETIAGPTATTPGDPTTDTNKPRDQWQLADNEYIDLAWSAVTGAVGYNIYYSNASGYEVFLASTPDLNYRDDGSVDLNEYIEAPLDNTTTGPKISVMALSGNRIWGTGDPDNPNRVYWGGVGQNQGAFSPFFGGGYVDIEQGGPERPTAVKHFRDGKGNPLINVFMSDPSGKGSTQYVTLGTATIGSTTIVVPSVIKDSSQVGTASPDALIEARNSIYYPSIKGFYVQGNKPNLLNIISTDEISVSLRPDVNALKQINLSKAQGIYYEGRLLWAVSTTGTENNEIWTLDLERRSWARAWRIGVKYFTEYTDTGGTTRLLGMPPAGGKIIEFTKSVAANDSGTAFPTKLSSGLVHWDDSHRTWARIKYVYIELSRPKGTITFTVSGTQKNKSFRSLGSIQITDTLSNVGFGTEYTQFGRLTSNYGNLEAAPTVFSSSSIKKRVKIKKTLNNMRWEVSTTEGGSDFVLMQIMVDGKQVKTSDPTRWK